MKIFELDFTENRTESFVVPGCVTSLNLSYNHLDRHALYKLIPSIKNLRRLNLTNCGIDSECTIILVNYLSTSLISVLDLSRNCIGSKGTHAFSEYFSTPGKLKDLNISFNNIDDRSIIQLANSLVDNCTLKHLNVMCNNFENTGANSLAYMLKTNRTLLSLDMGSNRIGRSGIAGICRALSINKTLAKLDITCDISDNMTSMTAFSFLKLSTSLVDFRIAHCLLTSDAVTALAEAKSIKILRLPGCKLNTLINSFIYNSLVMLDLSDNYLGSCMSSVSNLIRNSSTLSKLILSKNEIRVIDDLVDSLMINNTIEYIDLSHNYLGDLGARLLTLVFCKNIVAIKLANNRIGPNGISHIFEAISGGSNISSLNISMNDIGCEGAINIRSKLERDRSLTKLNVSSSGIGLLGLAHLNEITRLKIKTQW